MVIEVTSEKRKRSHYEKSSVMKTTMEKMIEFHQKPEALSNLTPPPIFVQLHRDDRTSFSEGEIEFTLWFGPIPIRWIARHQEGPTETSFADEMVSGPVAYWHHEHIFENVADGVKLTDRVTIEHKKGLQGFLTRLMFDGLLLKTLFFYRHMRTKMDVE